MKTIETKAKGITINAELFTGINDFLAVYEDKPTSEAYKEHDTAAHLQDEVYTESRQDFTGVEGYEDAVNKFRNGVNVNAIKTARAAARQTFRVRRACIRSVVSFRQSGMYAQKRKNAR